MYLVELTNSLGLLWRQEPEVPPHLSSVACAISGQETGQVSSHLFTDEHRPRLGHRW
jgi:hypothetical protein